MRKDEGKRDGRVWARFKLAACVARGGGHEGLRRGQDVTVLGCWRDHGWFVDSTPEGRRIMRAAADVPCLDSLTRRRDWRGGGTTMRGQTCKGGGGKKNFT